jgi:hypothetical protein
VNTLIAVFGLVIGMMLVIYGTVAENRWGLTLVQSLAHAAKHPCPQFERPGHRGRLCGVATLAQLAELKSISGAEK